MVLDLPLETIVKILGHDGSEKYWPEYPEPRCRRGFHIQEMIDLCFSLGKSVTPFQAYPTSVSESGSSPRIPKTFWPAFTRMGKVLQYEGVLEGETLDHQRH